MCVCVCVCLWYVCVFVCQHCCSEQKSCQEVKKVVSGSNLCPAKTDKPQQQSCQDASFGTAVSQHTSPEPDMGHYCRSAWARKSGPSMIWTAAVWQGPTSEFVDQEKCGKLTSELCSPLLMTRYLHLLAVMKSLFIW